jgi:KDO2-lipid IV(A) lauroyltransferase
MMTLARLAARVPLPVLHAFGATLGHLAYLLAPRFRERLCANLAQAGYVDTALARRSSAELGKGVLELPVLWFRPYAAVLALVKRVEGEDVIERAEAAGRGLILLTPHLGAFEMTAQWCARRAPLTILYRPPRQAALAPLMLAGRSRPNMRTATTDLAGVRTLLKALRGRHAIGMLPDQVPSRGEGEWADFFGRPAYTMTLAARLAESTGAPIVITYAERLARGAGYVVRFEAMPDRRAGEGGAAWVNRAMEDVVRRLPAQYLWAYNRYKRPSGAEPPPERSGAPRHPASP